VLYHNTVQVVGGVTKRAAYETRPVGGGATKKQGGPDTEADGKVYNESMTYAKMISAPAAGATVVVVVLLGYISYDISSDGHLARAVGSQNRQIARPYLGTPEAASDWAPGYAAPPSLSVLPAPLSLSGRLSTCSLSKEVTCLCRAALDLDRPPLHPALRAPCPLLYERPTLEELRSRRVRPYLFGGQQRPSCRQCHLGGAAVSTAAREGCACAAKRPLPYSGPHETACMHPLWGARLQTRLL
jgi:hypothetical protein